MAICITSGLKGIQGLKPIQGKLSKTSHYKGLYVPHRAYKPHLGPQSSQMQRTVFASDRMPNRTTSF